jgi:AraC-like DNA-binding protein
VVEFGVSRGIERAKLLAAAGISSEQLAARDGRLPRSADTAVWEVLADELGASGIGLEFAATAPGPRAYGVIALRDMTADTFGNALRRHCRHHRVIKDDVSALLLETNRGATIFLATPSGRLGYPPAIAEAALAPYAVHARAWTGIDASPEEVRFEHRRPDDVSLYERVFGCPVYFDQSVTCIRFANEVLELPLVHAQRDVCEYLDKSAQEAMTMLHRGDLSEIVYRALSDQLTHGDVSLVAVARALGLSVRTLQRRLKEDGVCFQDLVDIVRHHRALELLLDREQSVAWISDHLGFSDPRAFRRAFARWTGMAPDAYRRLRLAKHVA